MIRREIGVDGICVLTFDRPESGANIFDVPTMQNLSDHLDTIEKDPSLCGVIVTSVGRMASCASWALLPEAYMFGFAGR